jgi:hypothetical protein
MDLMTGFFHANPDSHRDAMKLRKVRKTEALSLSGLCVVFDFASSARNLTQLFFET